MNSGETYDNEERSVLTNRENPQREGLESCCDIEEELAPSSSHASYPASHQQRNESHDVTPSTVVLQSGVQNSNLKSNNNNDNSINASKSQQLLEAQHNLGDDAFVEARAPSPDPSRSATQDPIDEWFKQQVEAIKGLQGKLVPINDGPVRAPTKIDFSSFPGTEVLEPNSDMVKHCFVALHDTGGDEAQLRPLARYLQSGCTETAFVLLRGPRRIRQGRDEYHWGNLTRKDDEGFVRTLHLLLEDVIKRALIVDCRFPPRDIVILGYGDGGMAALAAASSWNRVEFGGVVSIGGSLPAFTRPEPCVKAATPALFLRSRYAHEDAAELEESKTAFNSNEEDEVSSAAVPTSQEDAKPIMRFVAHRLQQEEWTKQAVISFDGGGIRGYGSLLILKDLMNKIGTEEKRLDRNIESSFSPCIYKPTSAHTSNPGAIIASPTQGLSDSALFLPCHYFNYAAGTSTGGLICIMLSRLRMNVDECLHAYETLAGEIFGHPRPIPNKGVMWHKFPAKRLEKAVREVVSMYMGHPEEFQSHFAMERTDEDMCQCIVVACADNASGDEPYLFRTFYNPPYDENPRKSRARRQQRNYGDAQKLPIADVARATSAAPGYFKPITVRKGKGPETISFVDGGFGYNNPSLEAYSDILHKHEDQTSKMGPFISIGTGDKPLRKHSGKGKTFRNLRTSWTTLKAAVRSPSRTWADHDKMSKLASLNNEEQFPYYRFDGGEHLAEIGLAECKTHHFTMVTGQDGKKGSKTLEQIREATRQYLEEPDVQEDLDECAKMLVQRRQLRSRNTSAWDRYATFSYYECQLKGCQKRRFNTVDEFKEHLRRSHSLEFLSPALDEKLSSYRKVSWLYGKDHADHTARNSESDRRRR